MTKEDDIDAHLLRLIDTHPLLFKGSEPAVFSYVPAGWYGLLDKLCTDIEKALGAEGCADFEVRQVKEKFATLRFYYRLGESEDVHVDVIGPSGRLHFATRAEPGDDADLIQRVRELVDKATDASGSTCQKCGAAGSIRNLSGYLVTLCDAHFGEAKEEK